MKRTSKRIRFDNGRGELLSGIIETPTAPPRATALFSHCFTCGKDLKATVHISRRLAAHGIAVLRYDFTGLGESEGDFSRTNFTTNIEDIEAAARYLAEHEEAPSVLIGHSLGGTASALASRQIDSIKAVVTIASPSSTGRLADFIARSNPEIESDGRGEVTIGNTSLLIRREMLDDFRDYDIESVVGQVTVPILMFHSPDDQTLPYSWGLKMFDAVQSPKSFVTLDGSDHLLVDRPGDFDYVADVIFAWLQRYLAPRER